MTCYRKFAQVLDIVLRDSRLEMDDGEHICRASKDIASKNKRFDTGRRSSLNTFGRRIDLIVASTGVELSTSEWKKDNCTVSLALKQQCKNVRMNKAILTSLLAYDVPKEMKERMFCIGMDWTGSTGYMFFVKEFHDAYISKPISTLKLPITIDDITNFSATLDHIYIWRNHHEQLIDIVLPAATKNKSDKFMEQLIYLDESESNSSIYNGDLSPNVFFTPSRKRRASVVEEEDIDEELSD
ncbi:hypothetical protein K492DRAFT_9037 [Lichtheimia hyalospora FSU 10163]|nr:hypothetical protein K492DRAFT_9037 [Lichtheimia hyalospora FSU 10163]